MEGRAGEAAGSWWLELSPDQRSPGFLRFTGEGQYELTIIGSLGVDLSNGQPDPWQFTVFGVCDGTRYTLTETWLSNQRERIAPADLHSTTQTWTSQRMVKGLHVTTDMLFQSATLGFVGLSSLWDHQGHRSDSEIDAPLQSGSVFTTSDNTQLKVVKYRTSSYRTGRRLYEDHVRIHVTTEQGMSLEEWDKRFTYPLQKLVSAVAGEPAEISEHALYRGTPQIDGDGSSCMINPWAVVDDKSWSRRTSLLGESDQFFPVVVTRWLELAATLIKPMVIAAPRDQKGFLESEAFAAASAAEQLQRTLMEDLPTPFADSVKTKLAENSASLDLNSTERRRIVQILRQSEHTLKHRLELLVCDRGAFLFDWLLQGHISEWAEVTAFARNQLGHGLPQLDIHPSGYELLIEVAATARDVSLLRLLLECGYPSNVLKERLSDHETWSWRRERARLWPQHLEATRSL